MASVGAETKAVGSSKIRFCLNHPWTPNFNQFGGLKLHVLAVISTFLMVTSTCWVKSQCLVVSSNHGWRSNQRCIVVGNHFSLEMFIMTLHVPNQPAGRLGDSSQTSQENRNMFENTRPQLNPLQGLHVQHIPGLPCEIALCEINIQFSHSIHLH